MLTMFLAMLETEADRQKFTRLYEAMEKKIYAVTLRILGRPEQAEDAAQQAWLRLIQKWELVSALSWEKAGGYAVTAAKNAALDLTRLQSRTVPLPEDWDPPAQETGGDGYQYLVSLVRELPEGYRRVLELKLVEELSNREIAKHLRIRESTVSSRVMREQQVKAGEAWTAPSGQQVPSTITYTDAAGDRTNYIAASRLPELLDADISWDEETGSVDIGVTPPAPGDVTITVETRSGDDPPRPTPPNEPEYGKVIGSLEEVDPETVKDLTAEKSSSYYLRETRMQSPDGSFPTVSAHPHPASGGETYLVYTVTNHGKTPKDVTVMRPVTIANRWERFPTLHVQPGETLARVFRVLPDEDTNPMQRSFSFGVSRSATDRDIHPRDLPVSDVTVSLATYQSQDQS